jgi:hypothetical protein
METTLARDLFPDEKWVFHECFILAVRAPMDANPQTIVLFWTAFSGSRAPVRLGVTCLKSSASGPASTASFDVGPARGSGSRAWHIERERAGSRCPPDDRQHCCPRHHQAAGAKGGLRDKVSAVREVVSRPRSTSGPMVRAFS